MGARGGAAREPDSAASQRAGLGSVDGAHPEAGALELDRMIHERMRLGIVSALAVNGTMTFTDLRDVLGATDGNLSAHARRLEDNEYIRCTKSFEGRTPKTEYQLTDRGRRALQAYLDHMESIIQATRNG
ncbi:MAG: transcriptional regulator [Longimicrobiales bacterium]